jgi:hypothetical protein
MQLSVKPEVTRAGRTCEPTNLRTISDPDEQLDAKLIHSGCSHYCSKNGIDQGLVLESCRLVLFSRVPIRESARP